MADAQLPPWEQAAKIKKGTAPVPPPWVQAAAKKEPQVGYGEDMAKGAVPALAQGLMIPLGMGGDLQALAKAGAEKATEKGVNPFSALSDAVGNSAIGKAIGNSWFGKSFKEEGAKAAKLPVGQVSSGDMPGTVPLPTSAGIQKKAEEVTGPFYESKTGPGKALQTGLRVLPSVAMGGNIPGALAKAAGAGIVGEGAAEGANALKGYLPDAAQPWAEPVARAAGVMGGTTIPSLLRKGVTPLPLSPQRAATVASVPEVARESSAGQIAQSPFFMAAEARSPRMADLPQRQGAAYTQEVMGQAGAPGAMFNPAGIATAKDTGRQLRALRNQHEINPTEFAALNRDVHRMGAPGSELYRAVGPNQPFTDIENAIRNGPGGGNPAPLTMTGQRYGAMKQNIQSAADAASPSDVQTALINARQRMMDAFHNSMPPAEAQRLQNLDQQYSNYKTIKDIPRKAGKETITPDQVTSRAASGSPLETHAENAASVMTPLPKPNMEGGPGTKVLGGLAGLLGGAAAGGATAGATGAVGEGLLGAFAGASHANDVVQALKNAGGRAVAHPWGQAYLKNQEWMPGRATAPVDKATLARLL